MTRDAPLVSWPQVRAEVKRRFRQLAESELDVVDGDTVKLETLIEERYGLAPAEVRRILDEIVDRLTVRAGEA